MADKWVQRWKVESSSSSRMYTVAVDAEGNYGCTCPAWKFQKGAQKERKDCKHISRLKAQLQAGQKPALSPAPSPPPAKPAPLLPPTPHRMTVQQSELWDIIPTPVHRTRAGRLEI